MKTAQARPRSIGESERALTLLERERACSDLSAVTKEGEIMETSARYKVLLHSFLDPYFTSHTEMQPQKFHKNPCEKTRIAQSLGVFTFSSNCIKKNVSKSLKH